MLANLSLDEIKTFLESYENLSMKVSEMDTGVDLQMINEQEQL